MMLNKCVTRIQLLMALRPILIAVLFVFANSAFAQQAASVDISTLVNNFTTAIPNLMRFVTALAYVMGMFFIIMGVVGLKHFGEARTGRDEHPLKAPLIEMAVGAALLYLPTSVQVGMSTFWATTSPIAYIQATDPWSEFMNNILMIIQLIGTIAFIRGLMLLTSMSKGGQQGGFGKAMAHIVGGILCVNMYQVVQVIMATLGVSQ